MGLVEDTIQKLSQLGALQTLGLVVGLLTLYSWIRSLDEQRRIHSLGASAPKRRTYVPLGLPFIWQGVKHAMRHENYKFWLKCFVDYGNPNNPYTFEANAAGRRVLFTADPENIKAILATQFADYGKGEVFHREWKDFLGDSIFVTDHEQWHDSRQLLRPQFNKDRLSDLDIFEKHFQIMLPKLSPGRGETVEVVNLFFRYTLDVSTDFLLGRSVGSLVNPQVKFAKAFGDVQHVQSIISRMGPLNWLMPRKKHLENIKVMDDFLAPYIEQTLRLSPDELEKTGKSDHGYTFLHALGNYTRDRKVLRDQLTAVLLAGRDTTACTLSWVIYELSKKPKIVARVREEIKNQVGLQRRPTYDDLKAMRYLQHILNETLRLYPIVPFNVREAIKDTTLPRGGGPRADEPIGLLKNTPIAYSPLVMQRREDLYPHPSTGFPPVQEFVPERWDGWTPKAWTYIPFNGGPRICIGQQFALTSMAYTLTRLFQRVDRIEPRSNEVPGLQADIVLQPANGVRVAMLRAENEK